MKLFYQAVLFAMLLMMHQPLHSQNFDINALKRINVNRNQNLDPAMKFISNSEVYAGIGIPVSVCIAGLVQHDGPLLEKGINCSLALAANSLNTFVLKRVVNRDRPSATYSYIQAFEPQQHYSFPSGHTSNAFCDAMSLSLNFKKWYVVVPSFAWASSVGYSRMHLGMHYPSDVAAGALLGIGSAWITYKANQWLKKYYTTKYTSKVPE